MLCVEDEGADEFRLLIKRVLDAVFVALCLPMLVVAVPVKLTPKGPVLFRQQRCGLNGRLFACYKFRSMIADAESKRAEVEHLNEKSGPAFKIRDDPHTTNAGQYLMKDLDRRGLGSGTCCGARCCSWGQVRRFPRRSLDTKFGSEGGC